MPESPAMDLTHSDVVFAPPSSTPDRPTPAAPSKLQSRTEKPTVRPKPQSMQLHIRRQNLSSHVASENNDVLAARFSSLRVQHSGLPQPHPVEVRARDSSDMSSSTELTPSSSDDSSHYTNHSTSISGGPRSPVKPSGPRSMPMQSAMPAIPPKIPLSPQVLEQHGALPQAPKPAYDPSKSAMSPVTKHGPVLSRKENITGTDERSPRSEYRNSGPQRLPNGIIPPSRSSSMQPPAWSILAAELYDRFRTSSILVIDVRSREEYDAGHIHAKSSMCIEPVGIDSGMAAEELEDRLITSPSVEQSFFDRRNEFDLVVYHDQCTRDDRFLQGPPNRTGANHLRALHDTLFEFNDLKPLRKRPVVLLGGIESWVDLVGKQALAISKSAASIGQPGLRRAARRPNRPSSKSLIGSSNSSLEVRKRRLREQKLLNADEEQKWLEKAQEEHVNAADLQPFRSDGDTDSNEEEPPSPFVHSYEDFLRRFPAVVPEQQPMRPMPPPPKLPPPPPALPPPSAVSMVPSIPSRPAPAVPRLSYSGVSEREVAQYSPIARQTSASQQPLYTSRSFSQYRKLPRTGLVNFGVTCYMNATIQCLLATIPLSQFFLGDGWRASTRKNWKGSNGILPQIVASLVITLWQDDKRPVRPSTLRNFCARLKDEWGVDRQQDAKEFFDFLVDCLHEDLNINFDRSPLQPLTEQQEMVRERLPICKAADTEWGRYSHRELSYISDLFAGQHASRLRCTVCKNTSTTYEAFYSISVEIPTHSPRRGTWDVYSCLRSYCQEEKLSGDEVWKCPHCNCEREATKKIIITRAPKFLVVHFKRFEMRRGNAKKIHTPIHFPLYGLNVSEFTDQGDPSRKRHSNESVDAAASNSNVYDAYAVMRHIGSTGNGGHYVSLVKDSARSCWRKFDDEKCVEFDPASLKPSRSLQNEEAYIVFYERALPR